MSIEREQAATIIKRNGAYLICQDDPEDALTPHDQYDVASSLVVAKQIAVRRACEIGFTGRGWWEQRDGYLSWTLRMTWTEEPWEES